MGKRSIIKKVSTKYYVERDRHGRFKKWTRIGRSLRADRRKSPAKTTVKPGYGHRGDLKKRSKR